MDRTCLVTGGAGFIGCAASAGLADRFDRVVAFDTLLPQIHARPSRPIRLDQRVELFRGDVTAARDWDRFLIQVRPEVVVHGAAETGTGESLTQASRHGHVNVVGTTEMLDAFVRHRHVPRLIVLISSRAIYGEGQWQRPDGTLFSPGQRSIEQLKAGEWDFPNARALPSAAPSTPPKPVSIYGATKLAQEQILSVWSASFGNSLRILRFQNVFGEGQSLNNPYSGIAALFCRLAREGRPVPLFEDGGMVRDFVHVADAAAAIAAAIETDDADQTPIDIGTGVANTIADLAAHISDIFASPPGEARGQYRFGDVRHAACRIDEARRRLGWSPKIALTDGLQRLSRWVDDELAKEPNR